ncbi:DUF6377 domain-containing protein [Hymenobacter sp. ASUV-10]|uniref:DUF6377 domain-containing protein n=1 Tax=Hymenobacter aranciens TaxID=3063996 RepID=A0ABT9B9R8_9BACT|nr:DUF6377 domain-containing protein [Hymenobacter sp. ASUV-10]MDO7874953.1 DUF6377 domain-containing protein [Hymenobacter sp. ASUV-10]
MKLLTVLLGFLLSSLPFCAFAESGKADSLLTELNQALAHKNEYDGQRLNRIAVLTSDFIASQANNAAKFELGLRIYDEYKAFKYDSAFVYCQKIKRLAEALKQPEKIEIAKLKLAFVMLSSGLFKETFETLDSIDPGRLSEADKHNFYFLKARAYSDLGDFNQDQTFRPVYYKKALAYADTTLQFCPPGSYEYLSVQEFRAQKTGNLAAGLAVYNQIRRLPHLGLHQLAVSASTLAYLYELEGQEDKAFELLLVSAIADVKTATKETVAIFKLSDYCYRRGDLKNAYTFIKEARDGAAFYKARQRQIEISHISSIIEGQKINIIENQRKSLKTYAVIMTLLAVVVIGFAVANFRQLGKLRKAGRLIFATNKELRERNEELRQLNHGLNEANKIKDEYIGFYFHNSSQYIDKIEVLKKRIENLLDTKQYGAAQKLVDSVNIKNERNELLKGFDTVFLRLFPNFITQFNALFEEDERIKLLEDQLLTTELRIFALIRLGIDDSEQISRMLGYSINTIYSYKTRVKKRSFLPNEEFEARIQAIQAV